MRSIARVTTDVEAGEHWLRVEGELEIDSVPRLEAAVAEALASNRRDVVVDLSAVTFIDSTGLAGLLAASRVASRHGRRLRIHAPSGHEARVLLNLSGTGGALGLFPGR